MVAPSRLLASVKTPIYYAADDYREAVRKFEHQVLRTRHIRKSVERLVDQLEDSTSRLKSAARDPGRFDRLYDRFVKTDALHARVELTFFGNSLYPPDQQISECWGWVLRAHRQLVQEIIYLRQLRRSRRGYSAPIVDHSAGFSTPLELGRYGSSVLRPQSSRLQFSAPATPSGVHLQRSDRSDAPTRRRISTGSELRSAVIGAKLERN